jgi:hypothetical protein
MNMPDKEIGGGSFNTNMFPDAEKRTVEFYCNCNIRSLRLILERAKEIPELEIAAHDVWDDAKVYFPKEFGKSGSPPGPVLFDDLLKKIAYKMDIELPEVQQDQLPVEQAPVLRCQFCGKPCSSTSGKTLHEKACKSRPQNT